MAKERRSPPNPEHVVTLTPEQAEIFMQMAEAALQVLRDDVPFEKVKHLFGRVTIDDYPEEVYFRRFDLPGVRPDISSIRIIVGFRRLRFGDRAIIGSIQMTAKDFVENISRHELSRRLGLPVPTPENRSRPRRSSPMDSNTSFSYTLMPEGEGYPVLLDLHYSLAGTFPMLTLNDELPEHTRYFTRLLIDRYWDKVPDGPLERSTGERCPLSGAWTPKGEPEQEIYFQRGGTLPKWKDESVNWVWKDHGFID